MKAYQSRRGQRPDAMFAAAGLRKDLLMRILEGNMTPEEKRCITRGERRRKRIRDGA